MSTVTSIDNSIIDVPQEEDNMTTVTLTEARAMAKAGVIVDGYSITLTPEDLKKPAMAFLWVDPTTSKAAGLKAAAKKVFTEAQLQSVAGGSASSLRDWAGNLGLIVGFRVEKAYTYAPRTLGDFLLGVRAKGEDSGKGKVTPKRIGR